MRTFLIVFVFSVIATVSILGLRGTKFTEPPLYIFHDMVDQAKYKPQGRNEFFANEMNDRPEIPGTILRGHDWIRAEVFSADFSYAPSQNEALFTGKIPGTDTFYVGFPIPVTNELMEIGRNKYNTTCYVCHGLSGNGNGITKNYGMIATPCFHRDERFKSMPEGEFFNTITHGKGQMNPYADKLTPVERWGVILYIRALLRSQNSHLDDVPEQFRSQLN